MIDWSLERETILIENVLNAEAYDFTAKYMAVSELLTLFRSNPEVIRSETITALKGVFKDSTISRQTQSYFLYKDAAKALCSIIVQSDGGQLKEQASHALMNVLSTTAGYPLRAAAESLGSLPFRVHGPKISKERVENVPDVEWQNIPEEMGIRNENAPALIGRSLVSATNQDNSLLVVKLAQAENSRQSLYREAAWMEYLGSQGFSFPVRFNIPVAIKLQGSHVFRLENIPVRSPEGLKLHPDHYAIGFIAHKDYFTYPNNYGTERSLTTDEFMEVMFRNAWLFGKLTSRGIVHSAPIPLFHNRVQRHRRADNGLYEWQRAGRLDRWLGSCCYPNFGITGIRDFEHFIPVTGHSRNLYRYIGNHLLSLFLVAGSYFRNKDKEKVGFDRRGKPVDARDLFDKHFFKELVQGIFTHYFHGFVGREFSGTLPFDFDELTALMIDEMGVDRHMGEILRVVDQREMTNEQFRNFLYERGYPELEVRDFQKGLKDITIYTGPHLGGFNQRISLPEFIESVGSMSALCIFGRYLEERSSEREILQGPHLPISSS